MNDSNLEKLEKEADRENSDIADNIKLEKDLYDILTADNFDFDKWMKKFDEYEKKYSRFFYSHISQYIFDEPNDIRISKLLQNITIVTRKILITDEVRNKRSTEHGIENKKLENGQYEVSYNKYLMIFRLYDHCHLAYGQWRAYKTTKTDIEQTIKEISESNINEHKNEIELKIKDYEKNVTSQLIGLVALFTALSFVIFGGISSFGSIFQIVKETLLTKIFILLDVWLICMFNLFVLFIQMIAMVTEKEFKIKKSAILTNIVLTIVLCILIALYYYKIM